MRERANVCVILSTAHIPGTKFGKHCPRTNQHLLWLFRGGQAMVIGVIHGSRRLITSYDRYLCNAISTQNICTLLDRSSCQI